MKYRVVVVSTNASCCSQTSLSDEVEEACNKMASSDWVLISAYPETVQDCPCVTGSVKRAVFMIFAKQ
jgi:hypothetical protein